MMANPAPFGRGLHSLFNANTEVYSWGKDRKYQIQLMSGHHVALL